MIPFILSSPFAQAIAGAVGAVLAVLGYGWLRQRQGASTARKEAAAKAAAQSLKHEETRDEISDDVRSVDARSELHRDWRR